MKLTVVQLENVDSRSVESYLYNYGYIRVLFPVMGYLWSFTRLLELFTPEIKSAFEEVFERIMKNIAHHYEDDLRNLKRILSEIEEVLKLSRDEASSGEISENTPLESSMSSYKPPVEAHTRLLKLYKLLDKFTEIYHRLEDLTRIHVSLDMYVNRRNSTKVIVLDFLRGVDPIVLIYGEEGEVDRISEELRKADIRASSRRSRRLR